jgi:hypothetical protein
MRSRTRVAREKWEFVHLGDAGVFRLPQSPDCGEPRPPSAFDLP